MDMQAIIKPIILQVKVSQISQKVKQNGRQSQFDLKLVAIYSIV